MPLSGGGQLASDFIHNNNYVWRGYHGSNMIWEPVEYLLFTTIPSAPNTDVSIWFNQWTGDIGRQVNLVVRKGGALIKEESIPVGGGAPFTFDVLEDNVSVYIKVHSPVLKEIKEFYLRGKDYGINNIYPQLFQNLTKFNVSDQTSLTSININTNLELDRFEVYNNGLTGSLVIDNLIKLESLEFYNNNITSISSLTNFPNLVYFNSTDNNNLTGTFDFTSCSNLVTIYANSNNITGIQITGLSNLKTVSIAHNYNLVQSFDLTSCPEIELFQADNVPLTDVIWSSNTKVKEFYVANNTIPQASIQNGINSNKAVLEGILLQTMTQITAILDFDNCPNLKSVWAANLSNCLGISWDNSNNINNINISGMHSLSHTIVLTGKTVNVLIWLTGTNITATNLDTILNYLSGLNVAPVQEHPVGPGGIIYGDYETATGPIYPTSASLAAYNDLISRGYTIIGAVPA